MYMLGIERKILEVDHRKLSFRIRLDVCTMMQLPYFFACKTEFCSFLNNPKNLDPSYGSRSLGLFWKSKTRIITKFHRTDLVICSDF